MNKMLNGQTKSRLARLGRSTRTACVGMSTALATITPAFAASWPSALVDIDWRSYLDWHAYTGWRGGLLAVSIVLLIAALLIRATRDARAERAAAARIVPVRDELFLRRIGTMPIEPPESLELAR